MNAEDEKAAGQTAAKNNELPKEAYRQTDSMSSLNQNQKQWLEKIPPVYQQNYETAISAKSKTAALKAKCLDCTCWQRVEITNCPISTCPLFPYRPYKIKSGVKSPQKSGSLEKNG